MLETIGKWLLGIFFQQITVRAADGSLSDTTVYEFAAEKFSAVIAAFTAGIALMLNPNLGATTTLVDVTGVGSTAPKVVIYG